MKLLFDQNLSWKLVHLLAEDYPDSAHLLRCGLDDADDAIVWNYARQHGYTIVSKDEDFRQRSLLEGSPPKVIWLTVGNARTQAIAAILRDMKTSVLALEHDPTSSLLILPVRVS